MEKIRIRDGKKSDPGSGKTSRIRNTDTLFTCKVVGLDPVGSEPFCHKISGTIILVRKDVEACGVNTKPNPVES